MHLEVTTALHSPTMRSNEASRRAQQQQREREQLRGEDIELSDGDDDDEERFLSELQRRLLERVALLDQSFLVLRARQVGCAAARLHEALEPKRDADTRLIQAWTIQPQSHRKVKAGGHLEVLKLSTIFREVQRLRLHQQAPVAAARAAVELEIFPSLRAIEVLHTQVAALRHVHYFARQLRFLHVEQTDMDALRQILAPDEADSCSSSVTSETTWRRLETLQINCCALLSVDSSVNRLRALQRLDLGWNRIRAFEVPLETPTLEVLHLCHNELHAVPPIQALRRLRELDLSVNKIASLRGLEALASLEALDVSHNSIRRMADVELLVGLPKLRRLVLQHNPIARRADYRREVLFYLGEGVELDREPWSAAELVSMQKSRQSTAESRQDSSDWSVAPLSSLLVATGSVHRDDSSAKLLLTYPVLPPVVSAVTPQLVEIRRAASLLSPRSRQQQQHQVPATSEFGSFRTTSASRLTAADDADAASFQLGEGDDDVDAEGELFQTVDDYFTTQGDFIVVLDKDLVDARVEHANDSSGDDSDDDGSSETGRRSRKYTTSDFMRDFEEEELFLLDGAATGAGSDAVASRSVAPSRRGKQVRASGDGALAVRVLLSAGEASRYDLSFGKDGIAAALDIKPHEIVETIRPSDRETPLSIHRNLPDLVAVGTSIHSSRAKIVTLQFRTLTGGTLSVTYQIDASSSLQRVLVSVIGYLHQYQQKNPPAVCVCASCGAVSHLSREFVAHFAASSPLSSGPADPLVLYACLLCNSFNVRETSFDKMIAVYSADGVPLSAKRLSANPLLLPEKLADDGFYIEEVEVDASDALAMHECVLVASLGVREVAAPPAAALGNLGDDLPNDAREEAIVQAITMQ